MFSKRQIVLIIRIIMRFILMCGIIVFLTELGMVLVHSVIAGIMFILLWSWYFWLDNIENPVVRYDEK